MYKSTPIAALALTALALAGCSAATPGARPVLASTSGHSDDMEQAIATAAVNRWLSNEGAHSFDGFRYPYNLVVDWAGPGRGTVILYVDNGIEAAGSPREDLHEIAAEMLDSIHDTLPDIGTITATTTNGEHTATAYAGRPDVIGA